MREPVPIPFRLGINRFYSPRRRLFFGLFPIGQDEPVPWLAEPLQALLDEEDRREDIPAVDHELTPVIIAVGQIFDGIFISFEFLYTGINAADHLAARFVFANGKVLLLLHRQGGKLLFKYLTSKARQGHVGYLLFALSVVPLDDISICPLKTDAQGHIVIPEA